MPLSDEDEVRSHLRDRVAATAALTWEELDGFGYQRARFTTRSGAIYDVTIGVYWDMDEWASGINIDGRARAGAGWRRWWPYREHAGRGGADDPVPEPPPGWTPPRRKRAGRSLRRRRDR